MGNTSVKSRVLERAAFKGGYLFVKTEQPYYYPGNVVFGKMYIRCEVPMMADKLNILIEGCEEGAFTWERSYTVTDTDADGNSTSRTETETVYEHFHRTILDSKFLCFTFGGALQPGDYTVPFEFTLPSTCPSSVSFGGGSNWGKVEYNITA